MNLQAITSGAVGVVNDTIIAQIKASQGYTKTADFRQVPVYADPVNVPIQVQALQYNDIAQTDGLNIQGVRRAVYLPGNWNAVVRSEKEGGDLLMFPEMPGGPVRTWLLVFVFEAWPDWTKACVTLQTDQHA